jgi:glycerol-3-phosphate dehydrogenase (NAD(P)+)
LKLIKPWAPKDSIAVIGSGSWATALVKIFTDSKLFVHWYIHREEDAIYIKKYLKNPKYLTSVKFKRNRIKVSHNLNETLNICLWVVFAIPSAFIESILKTIEIDLSKKIIVSGVKGILPQSNKHLGDFLRDEFNIPLSQFILIAGPTHAEEIALERLSYLTLVSENESIAAQLQTKLNVPYVQCHYSGDLLGIEYASILKNIYAIASGIAFGLGYGDNFQSVLISNSMGEMERFLYALNPIERSLTKSAYLGDLLVTAYSAFSRNRRFGTLLGRGYTVKGIQSEMQMIAEGFFALKPLYLLAQNQKLSLPIFSTVYGIVHEGLPAKKGFKWLTKKLV